MAVSDSLTTFHLPDDADRALRGCIHCGLCLSSCPTYRELGTEMDSPRGRLYLIRAMHEGRLELENGLNADAVHHLDLCLGCRACETACPSGVKYGQILEDARTEIARVNTAHGKRANGRIATFLMRRLLVSRGMLNLSVRGLRLYNAIGLEHLVHKLAPGSLRELEKKKPVIQGAPFQAPGRTVYPAEGELRARVCFFTGCVMDAVMGDIHRATIRVLQHQGVEVIVPDGQSCCGALHIHAGDEEFALTLARRTLDALKPEKFDAFINNSAGCGAHIRTWGHLLRHDPAYHEFAQRIAEQTLDVTRFLVDLGLRPFPHPVHMSIGYDAPCHLIHAQREAESPLLLLRAIPALDVQELENSDHCCGAAGLYSVTQPEMAARVFAHKERAVKRLLPDAVVTGNPGCIMQFQQGLAHADLAVVKVLHPMQLAAMSIDNTGPERNPALNKLQPADESNAAISSGLLPPKGDAPTASSADETVSASPDATQAADPVDRDAIETRQRIDETLPTVALDRAQLRLDQAKTSRLKPRPEPALPPRREPDKPAAPVDDPNREIPTVTIDRRDLFTPPPEDEDKKP